MNKDNEVAYFESNPAIPGTYKVVKTLGKLPHGYNGITSWLLSRQAAKHREHIKELMRQCGCDTIEGYIRVLHCAGINDTFWVKDVDESITWSAVSLYTNEFDDTITRLAFEGAGLYGMQFSSTTPEFSIEGAYSKCCTRRNGQLHLIKRGSTGSVNAGLEPYGEVFTSPLYETIVGRSVKYSLTKYHNRIASDCALFTTEKYGYAPFGRITMADSPDTMLDYYDSIGCAEMFMDMVVADAVCFNQDRHGGNHGVLFDNDTLEVLTMAPVFDHNLALLPYAMESDFKDINTYIGNTGPRIGESWVGLARAFLRSETRIKLIKLKGYEIPWDGDEKFSKERARLMSKLINKQIDAILA